MQKHFSVQLAVGSAYLYAVPELRIYRVFDKPVGPHPVAMFEVNLFTPAEFGAFIAWLVVNRGPLSVLVHPNTDEGDERDHTQRATWMGDRLPLDLSVFRRMNGIAEAQEASQDVDDVVAHQVG